MPRLCENMDCYNDSKYHYIARMNAITTRYHRLYLCEECHTRLKKSLYLHGCSDNYSVLFLDAKTQIFHFV